MLACGFQVSILLEVYCVTPARSNRGSQEWRMSGTNLINQCVGGNTKCHNWRTVWLSVSKGISKENMEVRHSRDVSTTVSREYLIWWMTGGQTGAGRRLLCAAIFLRVLHCWNSLAPTYGTTHCISALWSCHHDESVLCSPLCLVRLIMSSIILLEKENNCFLRK